MKYHPLAARFALLAVCVTSAPAVRAWDYDGHRIVNQVALAALPPGFPAFVHEPAAAERIAFLAGEPDRWKNVPDFVLRQSGGSWTDHFLDLEQLPEAGIDLATVPSFRYDFVTAFAAGRAAHPEHFPAIDPQKNADHTREWPGFVPWVITEYYGRLKSALMYLRTFEELGTPEEVANAQANVIYLMGIMGHYVGDCAQPLHTTNHHNGWVGPNPQGYTTWPGIHSWMDSGLINKVGITFASVAPRVTPAEALAMPVRTDGRDAFFVATLDYVIAQHQFVEPLYQLEKAGKLGNTFEKQGLPVPPGDPVSPEGRAFVEDRLLAGGEMLAAVWMTAWKNPVPDTFLRAQLLKRRAGASVPATVAP